MEEDEKFGLILDRASQLRSKITDAIHGSGDEGVAMECDEDKCLFDIREALEFLEKQLASFQALNQRQRCEREDVLAKVDQSCKTLLAKLGEYKGDDLEVIHETATFARKTVNLPDSFAANINLASLHNDSKNSPSKNGLTVNCKIENMQKNMRFVLGLIAKSLVSFVGIVSVLNLAGFKAEVRKRNTPINILRPLPKTADEEREASTKGLPSMAEDGKADGIIKERVEIPFGSDFEKSNLSIAFG